MTAVKGMASLPPDILAMLEDVPELSEMEAEIREADVDMEKDPEFVGGYLKASFVEDLYQIMAARNLTKSDLAKLLGKSKQYVGRVLNERGNFTLESIAEFACALDMRVALLLHEPGERTAVLPAATKPRALTRFRKCHQASTHLSKQESTHGGHLAA